MSLKREREETCEPAALPKTTVDSGTEGAAPSTLLIHRSAGGAGFEEVSQMDVTHAHAWLAAQYVFVSPRVTEFPVLAVLGWRSRRGITQVNVIYAEYTSQGSWWRSLRGFMASGRITDPIVAAYVTANCPRDDMTPADVVESSL